MAIVHVGQRRSEQVRARVHVGSEQVGAGQSKGACGSLSYLRAGGGIRYRSVAKVGGIGV